jgi:hypothetical protein
METYQIPASENTFCGPAALAYVMRSHPDDVIPLIKSVMCSDDYGAGRQIAGLHDSVLLKALTKAQVSLLPAMPEYEGRLSLKKWLELVTRDEHPYLISVRQHVLVVHGDHYFDNAAREGRPASECPYLNREVQSAFVVGQGEMKNGNRLAIRTEEGWREARDAKNAAARNVRWVKEHKKILARTFPDCAAEIMETPFTPKGHMPKSLHQKISRAYEGL